MKLSLTLLVLIVLSVFFFLTSITVVSVNEIYWIIVSELAIIANMIGFSLYDVYVMIFIILVPFMILQSAIFFVIKIFKRKLPVINNSSDAS